MSVIEFKNVTKVYDLNDDMTDLKKWQYNDINKFASKLTLEENAEKKQINYILQQTTGETLMEGAIEIKANGKANKKD